MTDPISLPKMIAETAEGLFGKSDPSPKGALPDSVSAQGAGPSPTVSAQAPSGYAETYADVSRARDLGILTDPDLHHTLYGKAQGRHILPRIDAGISRVVMIAPSYLKQCGIGEYGRYLASEFAKQIDDVRVVRTSSAALKLGADLLKDALVIVNHGPGLFDGLNPRLSQGESTTRLLQNLDRMARDMGALPLIIHHSLLDTDHDLLFSRQTQILNSNVPSVAFISSAGRHFFIPTVELGVSPVPVPEHDYDAARDERPESVGFFGFFQYGGKDFDSLFHLVGELRGRLVGSVATSNADELKRFEEVLEDLHLPHDLGSGWIDDTELLERLKEADYFYLPQNDYDHWNNSATARFVANLDRPLFLPPHHPFLDMADGSIFASKEDLPRIVAHFREAGHFDQAVERVRAFRSRAAMANTATALHTTLVDRAGDIGQQLLETPSALSAERWLELPEMARAGFASAQGCEATDLGGVTATLPALYRAVAPRQYWRKHYELGDFIHNTLLETLHATYLNCAKRHIRFEELIRVLDSTLQDGAHPWDMATTARAVMLRALEDKGGTFHDPEVVLLENGALAEDWQALLDPARINRFVETKTAAQSAIASIAAAADPETAPQPAITNLAQLLVLPADILATRGAPIDLSDLDLVAVQATRKPALRLNRLVEAANGAELRLGDHLVFDHLTAPEVDPRVTRYALEDFIYFDGDMFLLNAVRCFEKRDPFPLEFMALNSMLSTLGMAAVLRHLTQRAAGRVDIVNFDENRSLEAESTAFRRFMEAARDPLAGLIEARNTYEMQKRHNTRWWLANKTACDALWADSAGNMGLLNLLYAVLSETPQDRADPTRRRKDPVWQMDRQGRFHRVADTEDDGLVPVPGRPIRVSPSMSGLFDLAGIGFFPVEEPGAWTRGSEGSVLLRLDPADLDGMDHPVLSLKLGFFGSRQLGEARRLSLSLQPADQSALTLFTDADEAAAGAVSAASYKIEVDTPGQFDLPLDQLTEPGLYALRLEIDRTISPIEAGISPDDRQLGVLLQDIILAPKAVTGGVETAPKPVPQPAQ